MQNTYFCKLSQIINCKLCNDDGATCTECKYPQILYNFTDGSQVCYKTCADSNTI